MYGSSGRIGLALLDGDLTIEGDMRRPLPENVEVHISRVISCRLFESAARV